MSCVLIRPSSKVKVLSRECRSNLSVRLELLVDTPVKDGFELVVLQWVIPWLPVSGPIVGQSKEKCIFRFPFSLRDWRTDKSLVLSVLNWLKGPSILRLPSYSSVTCLFIYFLDPLHVYSLACPVTPSLYRTLPVCRYLFRRHPDGTLRGQRYLTCL